MARAPRALALGAAAHLARAAENMNGARARYVVANPAPGSEDLVHGFRGEYFEVYSPAIRSRYSEVVWRNLGNVPLPSDIVARYSGKVMAVTGHEVDVVRKTPSGDVPVPSYESYNHHYGGNLVGKSARLAAEQPEFVGHAGPLFDTDAPAEGDDPSIPVVQAFSEHNGNEARQTYHGLPKGRVQLIHSPSAFSFTPMQINTRSPARGGGRPRGDDPLPRSSRAPPDYLGPNGTYSGLLECPCTTRVKKVLGGHQAQARGECRIPVASAARCFDAAAELRLAPVARNATVSGAAYPAGCSVVRGGGGYTLQYNTDLSSPTACGAAPAAAHAAGAAASLAALALDVDAANDTATITLAGDDGKWFGVGFGATKMGDLPYAVVVLGGGEVQERTLADHAAGTALDPQVAVVSNTVDAGRRTVVLRRGLKGRSAAHYTFNATAASIPFINAIGAGAAFAQHKARAAATLSLVDYGAATCVCREAKGTMNGIAYDPGCHPWPKSDLLRNHNPTCDVSTYVGGMECCRNGVSLLDADQEIPAYEDEVYFKWRFYFQDYDPPTMGRRSRVFHLEWALNGCDSGGPRGNPTACRHIEYDVPQAPPGTPPEEAVHTVTSNFRAGDMMHPCDYRTDSYCADSSQVTGAGVNLVMAGGHCHSPACLSLELFNADTGELLCRIEPRLGRSDGDMDEAGYIWLPPCQWGSAEEGLRPPPVLHMDTNLTSVKRANSTYYHYGVMAIWQMRGAYADD